MRSVGLKTLIGMFLFVGLGCSDSNSSSDPDGKPCSSAIVPQNLSAGKCAGGLDVNQFFGDGGTQEAIVGIEQCPDHSLHRYQAVECKGDYEESDREDCGCPEGEICRDSGDGEFTCIKSCVGDEDCAADELCLCILNGTPRLTGISQVSNRFQRCIPAECRTDMDCGGYRCGINFDICGRIFGAYCHEFGDECEGEHNCVGKEFDDSDECYEGYCEYNRYQSYWECVYYDFTCGD